MECWGTERRGFVHARERAHLQSMKISLRGNWVLMRFIGGEGIVCRQRELAELEWHWGKCLEPSENLVLTKVLGQGHRLSNPLCFWRLSWGGVEFIAVDLIASHCKVPPLRMRVRLSHTCAALWTDLRRGTIVFQCCLATQQTAL